MMLTLSSGIQSETQVGAVPLRDFPIIGGSSAANSKSRSRTEEVRSSSPQSQKSQLVRVGEPVKHVTERRVLPIVERQSWTTNDRRGMPPVSGLRSQLATTILTGLPARHTHLFRFIGVLHAIFTG